MSAGSTFRGPTEGWRCPLTTSVPPPPPRPAALSLPSPPCEPAKGLPPLRGLSRETSATLGGRRATEGHKPAPPPEPLSPETQKRIMKASRPLAPTRVNATSWPPEPLKLTDADLTDWSGLWRDGEGAHLPGSPALPAPPPLAHVRQESRASSPSPSASRALPEVAPSHAQSPPTAGDVKLSSYHCQPASRRGSGPGSLK